MSAELEAWLQLIFRWIHVVAAIMWIGQTWLFNWFESHLVRDQNAGDNTAGTLWMVHGGGFYIVEKQRIPELMPRTLHWFKWEAMATWVSGMVLLTLHYYMGGLLVEESASPLVQLLTDRGWLGASALFDDTSYHFAVGISVAVIVSGWIIYDFMVESPLGKNPYVFGALCCVFLTAVSYGLCRVMSGRAAYIHMGALFGTIMVANVWMRILPSQTKMLKAVERGEEPAPDIAGRGPLRSRHNSFLSIPMVFIMISNHFPVQAYGHRHNWSILMAMIVSGWIAAKWLVVAKKRQ